VLVGTVKGAFILRADGGRRSWQLAGPYHAGHEIYALLYDGRKGRHRLHAATHSNHFGAFLSSSDDLGRTWTNPEKANVRFPEGSDVALKQIWQIVLGRDSEPDALYAGVEPAALFVSRDAGETWQLNRGLFEHPHRKQWTPGGGGLCLHTILPHATLPERTTVAISTGGVYRSDDGGATWRPRNQGIRAPFLPEGKQYPEFGQCVHKVVAQADQPHRLFLQHHWGVYRSDDGGDTWQDVGKGKLPSDFGFAMVAHPEDADTVYVLPIEADSFRCVPEARLRVYRSRDAGESWHALTTGLPQANVWDTVIRDAMAADALRPAGIYFGTRGGQVWGSRDEGESWACLAERLPPVVCVKTAVVS
jgi:BNR/Asp-box repeat protein